MIEKNLTILDIITFGISVAGLVLLYRGNAHFTNKLTDSFNNGLAYLFGIISLVCWSLATYLLHKKQVYVHYSIDNLFVSLFSTIIIPSCMLVFFSNHPISISYNWI